MQLRDMEAIKPSKPEPLAFELSLRIRHPSIDPAELSRELGLDAQHSFRAGDRRQLRGEATSAVHSESYWLGTLDPTSAPVDAWFSQKRDLEVAVRQAQRAVTRNLGWALELAARRLLRAKALFERLRSSHGEVSLLVGVSPAAVESFSVAPGVSRVFSDLGITIEFDLSG
jgi:hypothetical protein